MPAGEYRNSRSLPVARHGALLFERCCHGCDRDSLPAQVRPRTGRRR